MRKKYVDVIKAFGIFLVILGHANFANGPLKTWIYSFHMPLFFFASGLLLREQMISRCITRSFHRLVIPYFLWACFYSSFSFENFARIAYGSYSTLGRAQSLTSLWFLPALFFGQIIVQFIRKSIRYPVFQFAACILLSVCAVMLPKLSFGYPWCIDSALLSTPFLMFGWLLENKVSEWLGARLKLCVLLGLVGLTGTLFARFGFSNNGYVMMAMCSIGQPFFFCITSLSGCVMVYGLSRSITLNGWLGAVVEYISQNTLFIFAVHKPIISFFEKVFHRIPAPWFIELLITGIGVLTVSCVLAAGINRYLPVFAGKAKTT